MASTADKIGAVARAIAAGNPQAATQFVSQMEEAELEQLTRAGIRASLLAQLEKEHREQIAITGMTARRSLNTEDELAARRERRHDA